MSIHNRGAAFDVPTLRSQLGHMVGKIAREFGLPGPQAKDVAKQMLARMLDELKLPKYLGDD